jgi:hypothetical protein
VSINSEKVLAEEKDSVHEEEEKLIPYGSKGFELTSSDGNY